MKCCKAFSYAFCLLSQIRGNSVTYIRNLYFLHLWFLFVVAFLALICGLKKKSLTVGI